MLYTSTWSRLEVLPSPAPNPHSISKLPMKFLCFVLSFFLSSVDDSFSFLAPTLFPLPFIFLCSHSYNIIFHVWFNHDSTVHDYLALFAMALLIYHTICIFIIGSGLYGYRRAKPALPRPTHTYYCVCYKVFPLNITLSYGNHMFICNLTTADWE